MHIVQKGVLPGNIFYELENNDRVVGGINEESTEKAFDFYSKIVKGNIYKTNSKTAEVANLLKTLQGTFKLHLPMNYRWSVIKQE